MNADKTSVCHIEYDEKRDSWVCFHCKAKFIEIKKPPTTTIVDIIIPFIGAALAFFFFLVLPILKFR